MGDCENIIRETSITYKRRMYIGIKFRAFAQHNYCDDLESLLREIPR